MLFDVVMELGLEEITNELIFHNGKGALIAYTKVIGVPILIYFKLSFCTDSRWFNYVVRIRPLVQLKMII